MKYAKNRIIRGSTLSPKRASLMYQTMLGHGQIKLQAIQQDINQRPMTTDQTNIRVDAHDFVKHHQDTHIHFNLLEGASEPTSDGQINPAA